MKKKIRCPYFELNDLERAYHDKEWGTPCRNGYVRYKELARALGGGINGIILTSETKEE